MLLPFMCSCYSTYQFIPLYLLRLRRYLASQTFREETILQMKDDLSNIIAGSALMKKNGIEF